MEISRSPALLRFGPYEIRPSTQELFKHGLRIKLPPQAFQVLQILLERQGQLVTREELQRALWPGDTFVDFDHGLNNAVRRIRDVLSDSAEAPRYIETLPRLGYRFVGQKAEVPAVTTTVVEARAEENDGNAPGVVQSRGPGNSRRGWGLAVAALVLFLAAAGLSAVRFRDRLFGVDRPPEIHSIAVLPLANLSGDPSQDYFAEGMTDELITALAQNRSLRVISRTSAMQYKGASRPLSEIARALGVDGILEGSVSRTANHVHINLQLIYAPTETHVWANSYDRDLNRALALPEELSQTIASQAKIASTPAARKRDVNPQAHDAYLQGRYLWFAENYAESRKYFEKAIQLQPDYSPAWSGLADSLTALGVVGVAPAREITEPGESAARNAVKVDDSFAAAHNSMAAVYFFLKWDWNRAEAESRRSLELDADYAEGHHLHSYILFAMNRVEESLEEQQKSTQIDPFERPWALGNAYLMMRQYDAAITELRMRVEAQSQNVSVRYILSDAYDFKGMEQESVRELEEATRLDKGESAAAGIRLTYERGGRKAIKESLLNDLRTRSRREYVSPFEFAQAYASLGKKDEALDELENAYREHSPLMVYLQHPSFDTLHAEPRYHALVAKMGMPPAY